MCKGKSAVVVFVAAIAVVPCLCPVPWSFAQGGPPMLTDDPGTPGSGAWEINFAYVVQCNR